MNKIKRRNFELLKFYLFLKYINSEFDVLDIVSEIRSKEDVKISLTTAYKYLSILRENNFVSVKRVNASLIPKLNDFGVSLRDTLGKLFGGEE